MNTITVDVVELFYDTRYFHSEYDHMAYTIFYKETNDIHYRPWLLGKKRVRKEPIVLFRIYADTQNPRLSNEWWSTKIKEELAFHNRVEEVEKNQLI